MSMKSEIIVNKNKNWDEYMKYYIKKEQQRIGEKYKMAA